MKERCITCALEIKAANCLLCLAKGEAIKTEDRLKPNNCPYYERMKKGVSTPPGPLRERRRET
jgi:hypothetical protein